MDAPTRSRSRTRPASRRARLVLALVLAALALVAGCAGVDALTDLQSDLEAEGFDDVTVEISPANAAFVVISASSPPDTSAEAGQDQAAELVWTRFPRTFERLRVTIDDERREWTYAELEDELGARPESLDVSTDIGDELTRTVVMIVLGLLVAGVLAVGLIGLVVFLAVRANRRNATRRPPHQPWMPSPMPGAGPVAPSGGWAPASAPPGPPGSGTPSDPSGAPVPWAPPGPWTTPEPTADAAGSGPEADDPAAAGEGGETSDEGTSSGPSLEKQPTGTPPPEPTTTWASPAPPTPTPTPTPTGPPPWATPWADSTPPAPPPPPGPRGKDPDARRLGRRPRGPVPDQKHTPPGWG